jgi:hypothetical protein
MHAQYLSADVFLLIYIDTYNKMSRMQVAYLLGMAVASLPDPLRLPDDETFFQRELSLVEECTEKISLRAGMTQDEVEAILTSTTKNPTFDFILLSTVNLEFAKVIIETLQTMPKHSPNDVEILRLMNRTKANITGPESLLGYFLVRLQLWYPNQNFSNYVDIFVDRKIPKIETQRAYLPIYQSYAALLLQEEDFAEASKLTDAWVEKFPNAPLYARDEITIMLGTPTNKKNKKYLLNIYNKLKNHLNKDRVMATIMDSGRVTSDNFAIFYENTHIFSEYTVAQLRKIASKKNLTFVVKYLDTKKE